MSLPRVLIIDDSEAMRAYGRVALAGRYAVETAPDGAEALRCMRERQPALVLLDLSMPIMDGDEVLRRMKADPQLKDIPVVIVSSEVQRAEASIKGGAVAMLNKPVRAQELRATVDRVLDDRARQQQESGVSVLVVAVGALTVALPLDCVRGIHSQVETSPLPMGPRYLNEMIDLHGEPVAVLDLAARFGEAHSVELVDRVLVVVEVEKNKLALCVDFVCDPERVPLERIVERPALAVGLLGLVIESGEAGGRWSGAVPILDPVALLSRRRLSRLPEVLAAARVGAP